MTDTEAHGPYSTYEEALAAAYAANPWILAPVPDAPVPIEEALDNDRFRPHAEGAVDCDSPAGGA